MDLIQIAQQCRNTGSELALVTELDPLSYVTSLTGWLLDIYVFFLFITFLWLIESGRMLRSVTAEPAERWSILHVFVVGYPLFVWMS